MITIKDFEENPSQYAWVNNKSQLVIDSIFNREFTGNIDLLLACVEDHMTDTEINYVEAIKDYHETMAEANKQTGPEQKG
jgi:hypothetical protein